MSVSSPLVPALGMCPRRLRVYSESKRDYRVRNYSYATAVFRAMGKTWAMSAVMIYCLTRLTLVTSEHLFTTLTAKTPLFIPCSGAMYPRPRGTTRRSRAYSTYSASMTVDGYRCSGSPSAQEIGQNNRDVQRDEVVNINDFKLKLTTVSGIEYSDPLRVDPDIVHSTLPPLATTEAGFRTAVAGSPFFEHLLGGVERKVVDNLQQFEPLERIALTANGSLQRVISVYYDSPVGVEIEYNIERAPRVFHRKVTLSVLGHIFCVAKSIVVLHSHDSVQLASKRDVGIGQIFRFLGILPSFELLNAGRSPVIGLEGDRAQDSEQNRQRQPLGGGIWRVYDLRSRYMSCRIHEEFSPNLFCINSLNDDALIKGCQSQGRDSLLPS